MQNTTCRDLEDLHIELSGLSNMLISLSISFNVGYDRITDDRMADVLNSISCHVNRIADDICRIADDMAKAEHRKGEQNHAN